MMGIPVEETLMQVVPVGATVVTAVAIVGRARLGRLRRWATRPRRLVSGGNS
jgi:hypothetical protein